MVSGPSRLLCTAALVSLASSPAFAQGQQPTTRAEQIELARRQKQATLWPERENPLVVKANRLIDTGFLEGIRSGQGKNGWQMVLTGMRPAQGQTFGIGYRRSDLFRDALSARGAVSGAISGAVLVDAELELNRLRRAQDTFVTVYTKYERSPRTEFYGLGRDSQEEDRTGYLLQTLTGEVRTGYRFTRRLNAGFEVGFGGVHTGPVSRDDVPSIETIFDATTAPGLFDDAKFIWWGGFAGYDARDVPRGPKRGGFYGINFRRYVDLNEDKYAHRQIDLEGQQFLPYFNETRVIALFVRATFAYTGRDDRVVPFYMLPKLGGNFVLRGFNPYRYHDHNAFMAAVEHRWYAFTGLEMAVFVDAGKTVANKGEMHLYGMNYSGGIGLRFRIQDAVVLRFDVARSREGVRFIWSMSDVSRRVF